MTATFTLEGMTCMGCVNGVQGALERMEGVRHVEVTLEPPLAVVRFDRGATGVEVLQAGIEDIGYTVVSVEAGAPDAS